MSKALQDGNALRKITEETIEDFEPPIIVKKASKAEESEHTAEKHEMVVDTSGVKRWEETQDCIEKLERAFNSRVLSFYIPCKYKLHEDHVPEIYNHLHYIGKQEKLVVVLFGYGGSPIAAYRIVKLLRSYTKQLTIVVPETAASAMTMVTLGADEVVTGPLSALSPIDTSIANHPLAPRDKNDYPVTVEITQVQKYLELVQADGYSNADDFQKTAYDKLSEKVHPIFLGTIQRSLSLSKLLMQGIAKTHIGDNAAVDSIVSRLNDDYPSHAFPILHEDLVDMGVNATTMNNEQHAACMDLHRYCSGLCGGSNTTKDGVRSTFRRTTLLESRKFRTFGKFETDEKLVDEKWVKLRSNGRFEYTALVKQKNNFLKASLLSIRQLRQLLNGEEVTED